MELGRGAKAIVLLAAFVIACAGIRFAAPLLVPLLLAALVATVSVPLTLWMIDRATPRWLAILVAILIDLGALAGLGGLIAASLGALYQELPSYQENFLRVYDDAHRWLAAQGVRVPANALFVNGDPAGLMGLVATLLRSIASAVSNLVVVLLIVVFMLIESIGLQSKLALLVPDPSTIDRLARAAREVKKYLVVKTGTSFATGLLVGIWAALWDLDLALLWGLLAFLLNFVPTIGSIIASIPPIAIALVDQGVGAAVGVSIGYVVVNFAIGNFFEPRIFGRALGISPLIVLLSMFFWGFLLGPVGALLSVPLTMILKIFMENTEDLRWMALLMEPVTPLRVGRGSVVPPGVARSGPEQGEGLRCASDAGASFLRPP